MRKEFRAPFHVFHAPGQSIKLVIPDGHRLVVFTMGSSPSAVPQDMMPMGVYEVSPEPLPGGTFPVALQVLPASQAAIVERLAPEASDKILRATDSCKLKGHVS